MAERGKYTLSYSHYRLSLKCGIILSSLYFLKCEAPKAKLTNGSFYQILTGCILLSTN